MEARLIVAAFLAAVTIGLFFTIGSFANHYGPRVAVRFLERGESYTPSDIGELRPEQARGYAFPVLFPLDLLFMIFLGSFLGLASVGAAESIDSIKKVAWLFALGPALYVAADLVEDILLTRMLLSTEVISQQTVDLARTMTKVKFAACAYSILQTIALTGAAALVAVQ
jgi:hypothetical protein